MQNRIDATWLSQEIGHPSLHQITYKCIELINSGKIPAGSMLPPIKKLSEELGVSLGTMSAAWKVLRKQQLIMGTGKQGTQVVGPMLAIAPSRFTEINQFSKPISIDLSNSISDPELLPDIKEALIHTANVNNLNNHVRLPITSSLEKAVKLTWPYQADGYLAHNSIFEALQALLQSILLPNSVVLVEESMTVGLLDIINNLKIKTISIRCDDQGPIVDKLKQALEKKPTAFIYQPRIHSPAGHKLTKKRLAELAELFKHHQTLIIEQDSIGDISGFPCLSLGKYYPQQTVHIRSYLKTFGHDLGLAVLSAPQKLIEPIQNSYSYFSIGWSNKILQEILAYLICDPKTKKIITKARNTYSRRCNNLVKALNKRGVDFPLKGDGFGLWIPVHSEYFAITLLLERGILVSPGQQFMLDESPHIRVSTSLLKDQDVDAVADALAAILLPPARRW